MITLTDISSENNGVISGSGYVRVPYFEMARFGVVFDNILVNTDYQLAEGEIVTLYDPDFGESAVMVADIPISEWLATFENTVTGLINNVKNNIDVEVMTNVVIRDIKEVLEDPNNGLSEEEIEKQQAFIDDKDKVRDAVKQVKEDFTSGKNDEYIEENFASNFAEGSAAEDVHGATCFNVETFISDFKSNSGTFEVTNGGNTSPYKTRCGSSVLEEQKGTFTYEGESYTIRSKSVTTKKGTIDLSQLKWTTSAHQSCLSLSFNAVNDPDTTIINIALESMATADALLKTLGKYGSQITTINSDIERLLNKEYVSGNTSAIVDLINYSTEAFLKNRFSSEKRVDYIANIAGTSLEQSAKDAVLKLMKTFNEDVPAITSLHTALETRKANGQPLVIHLIDQFSDVSIFSDEAKNGENFDKLILQQWQTRYKDLNIAETSITDVNAVYPYSTGSQRYTWQSNSFDGSPAKLTLRKGYQSRDKEAEYYGSIEAPLLSSTVSFFLLEAVEDDKRIMYLPAVFGHMQNKWKEGKNTAQLLEALTLVLVDIATDGVFRYLRTAKFLDNSLPLTKKLRGGINNAGGKVLATSGDELLSLGRQISKGSDEMLQTAKNRIAQYRIDMKGKKKLGGNLGYVEGDLNGVKLNDELVSSSAPKAGAPEVFDAKFVNNKNEIKPSAIDGAYLRTGDSEFQMLSNMAEDFNLVKGVKYPNMTGTIKVVSELPYCGSCSGVIHQLSEMLPNVKIIIVNGAK